MKLILALFLFAPLLASANEKAPCLGIANGDVGMLNVCLSHSNTDDQITACGTISKGDVGLLNVCLSHNDRTPDQIYSCGMDDSLDVGSLNICLSYI